MEKTTEIDRLISLLTNELNKDGCTHVIVSGFNGCYQILRDNTKLRTFGTMMLSEALMSRMVEDEETRNEVIDRFRRTMREEEHKVVENRARRGRG